MHGLGLYVHGVIGVTKHLGLSSAFNRRGTRGSERWMTLAKSSRW